VGPGFTQLVQQVGGVAQAAETDLFSGPCGQDTGGVVGPGFAQPLEQ